LPSINPEHPAAAGLDAKKKDAAYSAPGDIQSLSFTSARRLGVPPVQLLFFVSILIVPIQSLNLMPIR
jgi:hypothetical protein